MREHIVRLVEHNVTNLKYISYHFGTPKSSKSYLGSGSYWMSHLQKHGKDVTITTLFTTTNKEEAMKFGVKISQELDIVNSDEFANLVVEDCGSTAIQMQDKEVRARAAVSMKATWRDPNKNQKLLESRKKRGERYARKEFTLKELEGHKKISAQQKGKTMQERLGDPSYVDPRKGISKPSPRKGKKMPKDWVNIQAKPFVITSQSGEKVYKKEEEWLAEGNNYPTLAKLKKNGCHKIKRMKNTRHQYKDGETITFRYL